MSIGTVNSPVKALPRYRASPRRCSVKQSAGWIMSQNKKLWPFGADWLRGKPERHVQFTLLSRDRTNRPVGNTRFGRYEFAEMFRTSRVCEKAPPRQLELRFVRMDRSLLGCHL